MINTQESKKIMFRLKAAMKQDFSLAIVKRGVGAQHFFEAITERLIAFDNDDSLLPGEKKFLSRVIERAKELQAEAKLCV